MEAGFCGGFVAQWFMAAFVRHPGFESRSCRFYAFLLSLSADWIPINVRNNVHVVINQCVRVPRSLYSHCSWS